MSLPGNLGLESSTRSEAGKGGKMKKEGMASDKSSSKGQAWFCTTGLASDVVIEVGDMTFHLHKFPLMYRSKKLHELITQQQQLKQENKKESEEGEIEEEQEEEELHHIPLPDFPCGSDAFEAAAKFCYGVKIEFTASNIVPIRCAAEYLEMTDEISEGNLIGRSDRFLTQTVLRNLKDSVKALRSCDGKLLEMADELGITQRCVDSIAAKASSSRPSSLFGWPMNDVGNRGDRGDSVRMVSKGIDARPRRKNRASSRSSSGAATAAVILSDSWFDELSGLSLPVFKRVISAMKARDLSADIIESSLISYAKKSIPGLSRSSRKSSSSSVVPLPSEPEQVELLETLVTNLPLQRNSTSTSMRFLFGLLRTASILRASDSACELLERKIGSQLERATLDDLLMPSYSYQVETLYDVNCLERMLAYFLEGLQERIAVDGRDGEAGEGRSPLLKSPLLMVGKLIDSYLSEIASDVNLHLDTFCRLAFALPDQARVYDDGLYRAVDVYLKAHSGISEADREKVCGIMDCQKLTLEACTHAAQNERLPLRAVVQVLFFEQLQLRHAIAGSLMSAEPDSARLSGYPEESTLMPREGGRVWRSAVRDNQVLRLDMDSMRNRVQELERECCTMKKAIEKIDRSVGMVVGGGAGRKGTLSQKFGCKFRTQVCDSQERDIVDAGEGRNRRIEHST